LASDLNKKQALFLNLECINTLNEGLLLQHAANGCPKPKWSRYLSFLKSKTFADLTRPKFLAPGSIETKEAANQGGNQEQAVDEPEKPHPKMHTIFSTECTRYFDWQTVGLVHSFHLSGQPGNITRLLSCTDEDLKQYAGHDLAPTHYVPSMSRHPLTGDWYYSYPHTSYLLPLIVSILCYFRLFPALVHFSVKSYHNLPIMFMPFI
jgi:hypothetical protein